MKKRPLKRLRQGAPLMGDDGILTTSMKRCLEAAMERWEKRSKPAWAMYKSTPPEIVKAALILKF